MTDVVVCLELGAPPRTRQQEVLLIKEQQGPTQNFPDAHSEKLPAALEEQTRMMEICRRRSVSTSCRVGTEDGGMKEEREGRHGPI